MFSNRDGSTQIDEIQTARVARMARFGVKMPYLADTSGKPQILAILVLAEFIYSG